MPEETMETKVAVMQRDMIHFGETMKDFKTGQDKMQASIESMSSKLDLAYVTKEEFLRYQTEVINPLKKIVTNLLWWLALFIGGGGTLITLINWFLIYKHG